MQRVQTKSLQIVGVIFAVFGCAVGSAQSTTFRTLGVDTNRALIPLEEILSGGPPPQGIPALGFSGDHAGAAGESAAPQFVTQRQATWLAEQEPVIALSLGGESRIYPLQILTWHEIVNDTLGGVPVAVTFCPLCNSALAFDRRVPLSAGDLGRVQQFNPDGKQGSLGEAYLGAYAEQQGEGGVVGGLEVTFGVSGLLYNSNLLMFDSQSSTLWSQLVGEGVVGSLTGTTLVRYPAPIVSFREAQETYPDAAVLSQETGFSRDYGSNPYVGYDDADSPAFLFRGETDGRLPPKERVVTLELGDGSDAETVAYPFRELSTERVVNDTVGGQPITVFWAEGTRTALGAGDIADAQDVGAANVFRRQLGGQTLTFRPEDGAFRDEETGSQWTLLGEAVAGELSGQQLTSVVHDNTLWFAWAAFKPETRIYGAAP